MPKHKNARPRDRVYQLGHDDKRAKQLNPNHEQYWRTRGGRLAPSEGGGWPFLLTAVGVAAAALAAVAVAASAASEESSSREKKDATA